MVGTLGELRRFKGWMLNAHGFGLFDRNEPPTLIPNESRDLGIADRSRAEDSIDLSLLKSKVRVLVTITDGREVFFRESKVLGNL